MRKSTADPLRRSSKTGNGSKTEFISKIQKRGAEVIAARGKSSAASAANAAIGGMRSILFPTPAGDWFSSGVYSNGNPYGIAEDLVFSFPCRSKGKGDFEIVSGLKNRSVLERKNRFDAKGAHGRARFSRSFAARGIKCAKGFFSRSPKIHWKRA